MTAFIGVLISCDIFEKNSLLATFSEAVLDEITCAEITLESSAIDFIEASRCSRSTALNARNAYGAPL